MAHDTPPDKNYRECLKSSNGKHCYWVPDPKRPGVHMVGGKCVHCGEMRPYEEEWT